MRSVKVGPVEFGNARPLAFIAGLCALESEENLLKVGSRLKTIFAKLKVGFVLKCSFDKANRSKIDGFRGPGLHRAVEIFGRVKKKLGVPLLTDVHEPHQCDPAASVADILQIPAFLCRQTDLLVAAGRTGKAVNIKKAQFLAPWDMKHAIKKVESTGNRRIILTERGSTFGYGNLVVDMRSLQIMKDLGYPVVFDCTHSVQLPGAADGATGGQREFIPVLARAAVAVGVAGAFMETHFDPKVALSDAANAVSLKDVPALVGQLLTVDRAVKPRGGRTQR